MRHREDRPHRPEVAAVLGAVDRSEVDRVGPHRGHLAREGGLDRHAGRSSCRWSPSPVAAQNARAKDARTNPAAMVPSRVGLRMGGAGYSCALVTTAGAQRPSPAAPARPGPWPGFWPALLAIVAAGVAIRVVYTLRRRRPGRRPGWTTSSTSAPCRSCWRTATGSSRRSSSSSTTSSVATAEHPPLYSVVLAGPALVGLDSPDAQRLAGSVFGAVTIVALGLLGRRLAGDRAGLLAAGLAAVYPTLIAADGALMSETLYGALVALSLLAAYRLVDAPSAGRALVLGALAAPRRADARRGAAAAAAGAGPDRLAARPHGAGCAPALVALVAFVVVLDALDGAQLDRVRPAGGDRDELRAPPSAGANCDRDLRERRPARRLVTRPASRSTRARTRPSTTPRRCATGCATPATTPAGCRWCWPPGSAASGASTSRSRSPRAAPCASQKVGVVMFFLLVPLAVAGWLVLRRRGEVTWILLVPFIIVAVTALTTYGNLRFREPAEISTGGAGRGRAGCGLREGGRPHERDLGRGDPLRRSRARGCRSTRSRFPSRSWRSGASRSCGT